MAQVFKRKWTGKNGAEQTSLVWYARFQIAGKDYLRSTGKTKHSEALAEMRRMIESAQSQKSVDRIMSQFRESLKDLSIEEQKEGCRDAAQSLFDQLLKTIHVLDAKDQEKLRKELSARLMHGLGEKMPLEETWSAWLNHPNTGNPTPKTLSGYRGQWTRFEEWVKKRGVNYLHEVSPAHAEKYAGNLWASGVSPRTYNAHTKFLRSLFKVLRLQSSVEMNPFENIKARERATESCRNLTTQELEACLTTRHVLA